MIESKEDAIRNLFDAFESHGSIACYWKTPRGIPAALKDPNKDVDILIDRLDRELLETLGYKSFTPQKRHVLDGVSHWLKPVREGLCHVDVHERIYTGETAPLTHQIPWSEYLLTQTMSSEFGIPIIAPDPAVLLTLVRFAYEQKISSDHTARDFDLCDASGVRCHAEVLLGREVAESLICAFEDPPLERRKIRALVEPHLVQIRSVAGAKVNYMGRVAKGVTRKLYNLSRVGPMPEIRPDHRGLRRPQTGLVVSVHGRHNASLRTELYRWLKPWFNAHQATDIGGWVDDVVREGGVVLGDDLSAPDLTIEATSDLSTAKQRLWEAL